MHQFFPLMTYRYDGVNKPSGGWRLTHLEQGYVVESSFDVDQVASCHLITSQRGGWALMEIQSAEREVPPAVASKSPTPGLCRGEILPLGCRQRQL